MDFLARTIGSFTGPNIPYTIGEKINESSNFNTIWSIHEGTRKVSSDIEIHDNI